MTGLRLNLGCGLNPLPDYVNVDKLGDPDVRHDLEIFPWPWHDDSVDEIRLTHVLEHLGHDPKVYLKIMQEMYRICRADAKILIVVPHFRHDFFWADPTHVRPITPLGLQLFSQRLNREWAAAGKSNSPLGLYLDVDFELTRVRYHPSEEYKRRFPQQPIDLAHLQQEAATCNNMIEQIEMVLKVVKLESRK